MLTVKKIDASSKGALAKYFADYYSTDGTKLSEMGRWYGGEEILRKFGMQPKDFVDEADLLRVMGGSNLLGEQLRRAGGDGTVVAGHDCTFSADSSVSALWATLFAEGRDSEAKEILTAHQAAVHAAVEYMRTNAAMVRQRDENGRIQYRFAKELITAQFLHNTSRLASEDQEFPDPQVHTHVLLLGAMREDGKVVAIENRALQMVQKEAGAFYRAKLAENLKARDIEVEQYCDQSGTYFRIKGVNQELADFWSKRTQQINEAAKKFRQQHGRSPNKDELKQITLDTRQTKREVTADELKAGWQRDIEQHHSVLADGLETLRTLKSVVKREHVITPKELEQKFAQDLRSRLSQEGDSIIEKRRFWQLVWETSMGLIDTDRARQIAEFMVGGEEQHTPIIQVEGGGYVTREIRNAEREIARIARDMTGSIKYEVPELVKIKAIADTEAKLGGKLNEGQFKAVDLLLSPGRGALVIGKAGTGKSASLEAARLAWEASGYEVLGLATAGKRARGLKTDTGIESITLAQFSLHYVQGFDITYETRDQNGRKVKVTEHRKKTLNPNTVLVIDEGSMVATKDLLGLFEKAEQAGAKIVLVGDERQLPAVAAAGGIFSDLKSTWKYQELTEIMRAKSIQEKLAQDDLWEGRIQTGIARLNAAGKITLVDTRLKAMESMVAWWDLHRKLGSTVVLTDGTNEEVDYLNSLCQARRLANGELKPSSTKIDNRPYRVYVGDRIMLVDHPYGSGEGRIENGSTGVVVEARHNKIVVDFDGYGADGSTKRVELRLNDKDGADIRLEYAMHVSKSQGDTFDFATALLGGLNSAFESAYVQLSRARFAHQIFSAVEDLQRNGIQVDRVRDLTRILSKSREKFVSLRQNSQRMTNEEAVLRAANEARSQTFTLHHQAPSAGQLELLELSEEEAQDRGLDWGMASVMIDRRLSTSEGAQLRKWLVQQSEEMDRKLTKEQITSIVVDTIRRLDEPQISVSDEYLNFLTDEEADRWAMISQEIWSLPRSQQVVIGEGERNGLHVTELETQALDPKQHADFERLYQEKEDLERLAMVRSVAGVKLKNRKEWERLDVQYMSVLQAWDAQGDLTPGQRLALESAEAVLHRTPEERPHRLRETWRDELAALGKRQELYGGTEALMVRREELSDRLADPEARYDELQAATRVAEDERLRRQLERDERLARNREKGQITREQNRKEKFARTAPITGPQRELLQLAPEQAAGMTWMQASILIDRRLRTSEGAQLRKWLSEKHQLQADRVEKLIAEAIVLAGKDDAKVREDILKRDRDERAREITATREVEIKQREKSVRPPSELILTR